jgi:hypothetical protein
MDAKEVAKPRRQPEHRKGGIRLDLDDPIRLCAREPSRPFLQNRKGLAHRGQIMTARIRQLQRPGPTQKEGLIEIVLQGLDLLADRRLGHSKLRGRQGKAHVTGGGLEGAQPLQRRQATSHRFRLLVKLVAQEDLLVKLMSRH